MMTEAEQEEMDRMHREVRLANESRYGLINAGRAWRRLAAAPTQHEVAAVYRVAVIEDHTLPQEAVDSALEGRYSRSGLVRIKGLVSKMRVLGR